MRKRVGLIGFTVLGAAMATAGLSGNLALAQERQILQITPIGQNGCGRNCARVPEPSSLILLGAGIAGLGIWSWRRKSK